MNTPDGPLLIERPFEVKTYDVDFARIVSNIVYVRWLEDLRLAMLAEHFPIEQQIAAGFGPAVIKTEITYRRAITIHDQPTGRMWVDSVRKVRCALAAQFMVDAEVAATAIQECCFIDLESMRPIPVPKRLVDRFESATASE